jgi:Golgi nucleoside diphosphatase
VIEMLINMSNELASFSVYQPEVFCHCTRKSELRKDESKCLETRAAFFVMSSGGLGEKRTSYSMRTLLKLLNGVFFVKIFYRKVALKIILIHF